MQTKFESFKIKIIHVYFFYSSSAYHKAPLFVFIVVLLITICLRIKQREREKNARNIYIKTVAKRIERTRYP